MFPYIALPGSLSDSQWPPYSPAGDITHTCTHVHFKADSRLAPSQWETALLCNDVSHWLGTSLESALHLCGTSGVFAQNTDHWVITMRLKQNGHHFAEYILKLVFLDKKCYILIEISLKFVPKGQINNKPALVQMMAWCQTGTKPLSELTIVLFTDVIHASLGLHE